MKNIELTNLLRKMRTAYAMAEAPTLGLVGVDPFGGRHVLDADNTEEADFYDRLFSGDYPVDTRSNVYVTFNDNTDN